MRQMVAQSRSHERELLLRAAICILYSHWEGFMKNAATGYICFVVSRGLRLRDLSPSFLTLGLISNVQQVEQSRFVTMHAQISRGLSSQLSENLGLDCEKIVNTRSNLNYEVLSEILQYVGIEPGRYQTKGLILDERLLRNRNKIAHGEFYPLDIDLDDYLNLHETIVGLLQQFRTDLENAAAMEAFRRNSPLVLT